MSDPLSRQVGGDHYRKFAIQPIEFIHKNNLGFIAGNLVKYACRIEEKGNLQDAEKIMHYVELFLSLERGEKSTCPRKQPKKKVR